MKVKHPGPAADERICVVESASSAVVRHFIPEGEDLIESVTGLLSMHGVRTGILRAVRGVAAALEVMTGRSDLEAGRVATFHGPHRIECPAHVLKCQGLIGTTESGLRMHAHATFLDASGASRGCHLIAGRCIAGPGGFEADVVSIAGAAFQWKLDVETGFTLLMPVSMHETATE